MIDKVQKVREKIEIVVNRRLNFFNGCYFDLNEETKGFTNEITDIIDSLQEDPVSVWHDASEEPEEGKDFAFVTYDGIMWARYRIEDIFLGWKVFRIQTELDKWAYVSDLLKL